VTNTAARLARIRGSLPAEEPGARGLERVARNPSCQRLRAVTIAGSSPATALKLVYGQPPQEGQSPFAIGIGNRFERGLFENGAARLLDLLRRQGRLSPTDCGVVSIPDLVPGIAAADLNRRHTLSERYVSMKLAGDPAAPNILIKPRLTIAYLGVEHAVEPDVLIAAGTEPFYRLGEVKSYPDRDGKTGPADIRSACRHAAVGIVALRQAVTRLGAGEPGSLVPASGDLILRVPGSARATLRPMTLEAEVYSLQRALDEAPRNLDELEQLLADIGPSVALDNPTVLSAVPGNYLPSCREHCALAPLCKQEAIVVGDPVLLSIDAKEELAAAGSLTRALDLLRGRGAPPRTAQEAALQQRLQDEDQAYRVVLRGA
jgi:hypothetical protein